MFKKLGIALCVVSLGVLSSLETQAADKAPEIKGGIPGKLAKVDAEKGTVTITREDGRERTFSITNETTIVGPRGGIVHRRLRDPRFHSGLPLTVVAQGDEATEIHLGFDRKARTGAGRTGASTSAGTTENTEDTPQPTPAPTRRTSRFRGLVTPKSESPETAKTGETDEDNDFPGKIKSADTTRHLLVITLLNGKDRSFLLSRDVKFTRNGRSMRQGLADAMIKPGVPVTVVTEEGGRKVKEVKVTPAVSRRARTAG